MNKVILLGRLAQNPELKQTLTGKSVATFSLAVSKPGQDRQADFFNIVVWDKKAEFCCSHLRKGQQVVVVGRLSNRSWTESGGNKRYSTEVHCNEIYFAGDRRFSDSNEVEFEAAADDEEIPF